MGTTFQTAPTITYCHTYTWETRTTRSDISIGMDTRKIRLQKNSEAQSRAERPSRHTSSLFEGLYMQSNAARCIHKLNGTKAGLQAIQSVMRMNTPPRLHRDRIWHQSPGPVSTSGVEGIGGCLQRIFTKIANPPIFWDVFIVTFKVGKPQDPATLFLKVSC